MRLFIAVKPAPAAAAHLEAAVAPLRAAPALASLRWTPAAAWHLTLAFIGEVDDDLLPGLVQSLHRGLPEVPAPRPVRCRSAGSFGDRLVWIGLEGLQEPGSVPLRSLARAVRRLARQARMPVDAQPWFPHLTIGRDRPGGAAEAAAALLAEYQGPPWQPEAILVVSSVLGASPVHEVKAEFPLIPGPAS